MHIYIFKFQSGCTLKTNTEQWAICKTIDWTWRPQLGTRSKNTIYLVVYQYIVLTLLVTCLLCGFMCWVPRCDVRCDIRIKNYVRFVFISSCFVGGFISYCGCLCIVVFNTYCVVYVFFLSSSCVQYVPSCSGLSIFDCLFGVLKRISMIRQLV